MEEHDVSLFWLPLVVACSQPLDVPCACGTFKKPVSSIGSVGSLVFFLEYLIFVLNIRKQALSIINMESVDMDKKGLHL